MMRRRVQAGFSLLELMVATVIAMASAVAIFQTMSVSEERRRSTTSGSEGLQSGVFGLAALERAVLSAGYNLTAISDTTYSSPVRTITPGTGYVLSKTTPPRPEMHLGCSFTRGGATHRVAPIIATDGGDGITSDTLTIFTGSSTTVPLPVTVVGPLALNATSIPLSSALGMAVNDWVLIYEQSSAANPGATRPVACTLARITAVPAAPGVSPASITVDTGVAAAYAEPVVIHLGATPTLERFTVDANGRLTVTNLLAGGTARVLADNVVSMQVQLGIDIGNDDVIDDWIEPPSAATWWLNPSNPLPDNTITTLPLNGAKPARSLNQIKSVRIGLLIRSPQLERKPEKGSCTATADVTRQVLPTRAGSDDDNLPAMPSSGNYSLSGNQLCLRYNTVTTVLGVRNALLSEM